MRPMRLRQCAGRAKRLAAAALTAMITGGAVFIGPPAAVAAPTIADRQRWYFDLLQIPAAQKISTGQGVVIGVVDSGVQASHPDLRGQVLAGKGVNGEAADGRSDKVAGHGTLMAGIIAGIGGGADHVAGIAPGAKILPVAVGEDKALTASVDGIRWAADNGAKVLNLSWGVDTQPSQSMIDAIGYALSKDVVVVAAAGNRGDGDSAVISPARIRGVIAVTGIGTDGGFWGAQSVEGPGAVLAAPAQDIVGASAKAQSGYGNTGGTSSAAAIVSAVAAMVRAEYPDMDAANVINRLVETADDKGPTGWDGQYGVGIVNPVAALTADIPAVDRNPLLPDADDTRDGNTAAQPAPGDSDSATGLYLAITAGVLVVLLVVVVVAVVSSRRRGRQPLPVGPPGLYPPPHGGFAPPQQGYPSYPPQHPPASGPQYPPPGSPYPPPGPPYNS